MQLLDSHDKVRHIEYTNMNQPQDYITGRQFSNKQIGLLFNLRCQSIRNIENNFHTFYNNKIDCPFKCLEQVDSQEHILKCDTLVTHLSDRQKNELVEFKYQDIFGSTDEQLRAKKLFQLMLRKRERLLEKDQGPAYHGNNSGPIY